MGRGLFLVGKAECDENVLELISGNVCVIL